MDSNNVERRIMGLHLTLGVGTPDMESYLSLGPPAAVADADADADGASGNINPSRPIAPRFNSPGFYWCQECGNLTQSSQWRRSRSTGLRDVCNIHYQRRRYKERRDAATTPNRADDA